MGQSILVPLRRPTFRRLVGAQFLAETGDGVVTVAIPLYVLAQTGSPVAMSLTFTAEMVAGAALGVVGGVLADRFPRQRVLKVSFLMRAILLVAAWLVSPVAAAVVLGVSARALGQLHNPSFDALVPDQAVDDMQQVLSLRRFIQSVSIIIGPAVGALSVWILGAKATLGAAAVLFVAAIGIHLTLPVLDHGAAGRRREHHGSGFVDIAGGMAVVTTTPFIRRLTLYWLASMATVGAAMASAVVWFEDTLDAAGYWYGLSVSAYGVGTAAATLAFGGRRFGMRLPNILVAAAPAYAATCALCVVAEVPWLFPVGWFLWGVALGPEIVRSEPEIVHRINPSNLGRAYAGLGVAITLGTAGGYAISGLLLQRFGPRTTTFVTSVAILAIGMIWVGPARRGEGLAPGDVRTTETDDGHVARVRTNVG